MANETGRNVQLGSDLPDLSDLLVSVDPTRPSRPVSHAAGQHWRTTSCLCACHFGSSECEGKPCDKYPYVQRRK